jgi:hypothetical protein
MEPLGREGAFTRRSGMSEMRRVACPSCGDENHPLGVIDGIQQYRCRGCGMVYYGPCGCDIVHDEPAAMVQVVESRLDDDWQMSRPVVFGNDAAGVMRYPGCS